jgi:hypothetical protein
MSPVTAMDASPQMLTVSLDGDGDAIGVDEDPMMRMAPFEVLQAEVRAT